MKATSQGLSEAAQRFLQKPTAVLVLHGPFGVGKQELADRLTMSLLEISEIEFAHYPYAITVKPDGNSISIAAIRELQASLIRSVPGQQTVRRVVRIFKSEKLTAEAQNALLKLLEEPPEDTVFIMTVDSPQHLLSTVTSRAQLLAVTPITEAMAYQEFGQSPEVTKAFLMSGGRVALLRALLSDNDHPLLQRIALAKDILQRSTYDRLLLVNELSKDRGEVDELFDTMELVASVSLRGAARQNARDKARQWQHIVRTVKAARQSLNRNAGAKLVLTDLFLHL